MQPRSVSSGPLADSNSSGGSRTCMSRWGSINAIRREKEGRTVRYFLNPGIATHIPNASARKAAREGAGPLLRIMEGGKP